MNDPLRAELLDILQHSLGLDEHGLYQGERRGYRNHYVGESSECRELAALGLMTEHAPRAISGGEPWYSVTDRGREVVAEQSPPPPKLTRGQKRYRAYLRSDSSLSFGDWLRDGRARDAYR